MNVLKYLKPKNIFDVRRNLLSMTDYKNKYVVIDEYNTVEYITRQWYHISDPLTFHKAIEIKRKILNNKPYHNSSSMHFNSSIKIITWKEYVNRLTKDEIKKLRND